MRVTNWAIKRAGHVLGGSDDATPLVIDCSRDSPRRTDLVLGPCPTRAPLSDWSRRNLSLSNVRDRPRRWRCISQIEVELRRFRKSWCDKRRGDKRRADSLLSQVACLLSELPRLLSYVALLPQRQHKRNERNRGLIEQK